MKLPRIKEFAALDTAVPAYWYENNTWYLYFPTAGLGNLKNHQVEEHEDGTISAQPSILISSHLGRVHGYLTKGEWRDVD